MNISGSWSLSVDHVMEPICGLYNGAYLWIVLWSLSVDNIMEPICGLYDGAYLWIV